jgi:DNA-binding transcriptional LysR family regulator
MPTSTGLYAWEFEKKGRELRVRVEGQLTFNNTTMIIAAAEAGFGLGYVMADRVEAQLRAGSLVGVLESWCQPFAGYHLYYPSRRQPSAAFSVFVEALRYKSR